MNDFFRVKHRKPFCQFGVVCMFIDIYIYYYIYYFILNIKTCFLICHMVNNKKCMV